MNIKAILLGVALLGAAADAAATISVEFSTMTYQGRLKESGSAVNGNRDVRVYVCDAFTVGACYSDTPVQSVGVVDGVFKTTFTLPGAVDLAVGAWFLEVRVGPVGGGLTTLSPREKLTSSPYAIASAIARWADKVDPSGILPGNLGSGVVINPGSIGTGVLGTGIHFSNGFGVGTALPTAFVQVSSAGGNGDSYVMKVTTGTADVLSIRGDGRVSFHAGMTPEYGANVMFGDWVHGDPNSVVGIGHPTGKVLTLATQEDSMSNIGTVSIKFGQMNLSDMAEIRAVNEGGQPVNRTAGLSFLTEPPGTGQPVVERLRIAGTGHVVVYSTLSVQGNSFSVGGSTLVVADGNVGIGTASPFIMGPGARGFEVRGTVDSTILNVATAYSGSIGGRFGDLSISNPTAITGGGDPRGVILRAIHDTATDAGALALFTRSSGSGGSTERMRIASNGSVGIGTAAPSGLLHLHATGTNGVHLKATQAASPTITTPVGCGTSPSAAVVGGSTDFAGQMTFTTGTGPNGPCATSLVFNQAYGAAPKAVLLTPGGEGPIYFVSGVASSSFTFSIQGSTNPVATYSLNYMVIE